MIHTGHRLAFSATRIQQNAYVPGTLHIHIHFRLSNFDTCAATKDQQNKKTKTAACMIANSNLKLARILQPTYAYTIYIYIYIIYLFFCFTWHIEICGLVLL